VVTIRKIEADALRPSVQVAEKLADSLAIPPEERAAFLKAARAALSPDRLALPIQPVDRAEVGPGAADTTLRPLPSGTVTFLFTDIEGSTTLWEQHTKAMRVALARHNTILRAAVEAHQGAIFKTVGDAVCAAFASAPAALTTALDAQHAMVAEDWGVMAYCVCAWHSIPELPQTRGAITLGRRSTASRAWWRRGNGGQVLLARGDPGAGARRSPDGCGAARLGEHRLKDLTRPEHIFQLVAADLPADFPPLTTLASPPHQPTGATYPADRAVSRRWSSSVPCCAAAMSGWQP